MNTKQYLVAVGVIIAAVLITGLLLLALSPERRAINEYKMCDTRMCFVELGQFCQPGEYVTTIAGITLRQEVSSDCTLERKVLSVPVQETDRIQTLKGLSATCTYEHKQFNPLYSDTLLGVPTQCSGPLADKLLDIAVELVNERN